MDMQEKVSALFSAEDDEEIEAAIESLTDKQKNLVLKVCVKFLRGSKIGQPCNLKSTS